MVTFWKWFLSYETKKFRPYAAGLFAWSGCTLFLREIFTGKEISENLSAWFLWIFEIFGLSSEKRHCEPILFWFPLRFRFFERKDDWVQMVERFSERKRNWFRCNPFPLLCSRLIVAAKTFVSPVKKTCITAIYLCKKVVRDTNKRLNYGNYTKDIKKRKNFKNLKRIFRVWYVCDRVRTNFLRKRLRGIYCLVSCFRAKAKSFHVIIWVRGMF